MFLNSFFIYLATFTLNCSILSNVASSITSDPLNPSTTSFRTLYSSLSHSEVIAIEDSVTAVSIVCWLHIFSSYAFVWFVHLRILSGHFIFKYFLDDFL